MSEERAMDGWYTEPSQPNPNQIEFFEPHTAKLTDQIVDDLAVRISSAASRVAARPQPDPTEGTTSITDLVMKDLSERREMGINKYGTELKANNGRDPLVDAYQESLDQTLYLRQAIEESPADNCVCKTVMQGSNQAVFDSQKLDTTNLYMRPGKVISVDGPIKESVFVKFDKNGVVTGRNYTRSPFINYLPTADPYPAPAVASSVAHEAYGLVNGDRQEAYGHPIIDFTRTADMWTALLRGSLASGFRFEAEDVAQMMILLKQSRERHNPKRDNLVDTCGYTLTKQMCKEWRDANPGKDPRDNR